MRLSARIEGGIEWVINIEWCLFDPKLKELRYREVGKEKIGVLKEVTSVEISE